MHFCWLDSPYYSVNIDYRFQPRADINNIFWLTSIILWISSLKCLKFNMNSEQKFWMDPLVLFCMLLLINVLCIYTGMWPPGLILFNPEYLHRCNLFKCYIYFLFQMHYLWLSGSYPMHLSNLWVKPWTRTSLKVRSVLYLLELLTSGTYYYALVKSMTWQTIWLSLGVTFPVFWPSGVYHCCWPLYAAQVRYVVLKHITGLGLVYPLGQGTVLSTFISISFRYILLPRPSCDLNISLCCQNIYWILFGMCFSIFRIVSTHAGV